MCLNIVFKQRDREEANMFNWYGLFKFLHVGASIVWVGGVITLVVLNARLAAERDQAAVQLFARHAGFLVAGCSAPRRW